MAKNVLSLSLAMCLTIGFAASAAAAPSSESLLPGTTKGFISTPNIDELIAEFNKTQLGELVNDPIMQPFVEDLKRQMSNKLSKAGVRVGITWADLEGVASGEVALAAIQPEGDKEDHALALVADVAGRLDQARELLAKIDRNQIEKGAKKSSLKAGAIDLVVYTLPKAEGEVRALQKYYGLHDNMLFASDHVSVAQFIAQRLGGGKGVALADIAAFEQSMQVCQQSSAGLAPNVRWFVEPIGFAEVSRAANGGRKKRGKDLLKVLANQGFTAIQGLGGYVTFATEEHEILHRTMVYAPAVPRSDAADKTDKYDLAARMLDFPNGKDLTPQQWVPRDLATYLTFNWKMREAFEHSKTMVDELADSEDLFEEVLRSIEFDPNGPQINVRKELVQHLAERATVLADYQLPITPKCERVMVAIELTDAAAVERTVEKAMEADPEAKKRVYDGHVIWEIVNEDDTELIKQVNITGDFGAGGQLGFGDDNKKEEKEEKRSLPNSAISVAHGHLIIATHVDFIRDLLKQVGEGERLNDAADYKVVAAAINKLGAGDDSFHFFSRTDEAYRVTYELMREGKMPEAETLFGKLLNRMMAPDEEGQLREQQIDGAKMPPYEAVSRYLGPAGAYVRSEKDGWMVVGCLLTKEAPAIDAAPQTEAENK